MFTSSLASPGAALDWTGRGVMFELLFLFHPSKLHSPSAQEHDNKIGSSDLALGYTSASVGSVLFFPLCFTTQRMKGGKKQAVILDKTKMTV